MYSKSVVAIGAHPDDIEWGCFGTLANFHARGYKIYFLLLTDGESNIKERRIESAQKAAELISAEVIRLSFRAGYIKDDLDTVFSIEEHLNKIKPEIIFTTSDNDRNQDRRNTGLTSIAASRLYPRVYMYETPSTIRNFNPQVFSSISETINLKVKAFSFHELDNSDVKYSEDIIKGISRFRAYQCSLNWKYAEAFEVVKGVLF